MPTKVVPPFDSHENLAYGTVKNNPGTAGLSIQVQTTGLTLAASFNAVVWPNGERPTQANAEFVRCTANAAISEGREFTVERAQEGSSAKNIKSGWQFRNTPSAKAFTDIQSAVTANPSATGTVYVTSEGSATNDGSSWAKAKPATAEGIMEAIRALPVGSEGGRIGKVELGAGTIECNSTGRYEASCNFFAKTNFIEVPGATGADVGAYVYAGPKKTGEDSSGVTEGAHIAAVVEGEVTGAAGSYVLVTKAGTGKKFVELWQGKVNERKAGFETKVGGEGAQGLYIIKPAVELPVGVTLTGRGRMTGYHGGTSLDYGTCLRDEGTGITVIVESGKGEKASNTLARGGVLRDLVVLGNPENLMGFFVACNFATTLEGCSFIGHGLWGVRIGERATVVMEIRDCEFRENGLHGLTVNGEGEIERGSVYAWTTTGPKEFGKATFANQYNVGERAEEGGLVYESIKASNKNHKPSENTGTWWRLCPGPIMFCGGLDYSKSPNSGRSFNVRCVYNFGIGFEVTGAESYGCVFSKTATVAGLAISGYGIKSAGREANGTVGFHGTWCEGNETAASYGAGAFYTATFQGDGIEEFAVKVNSEPATFTDCIFFNHTSKIAVKESLSSGPIVFINCGTLSSGEADTDILETKTKTLVTFAGHEGVYSTV